MPLFNSRRLRHTYAELTMNGELMALMHNINEEAHVQVEELTDKLIRQQGYSDTSDTMLMFRRSNKSH